MCLDAKFIAEFNTAGSFNDSHTADHWAEGTTPEAGPSVAAAPLTGV